MQGHGVHGLQPFLVNRNARIFAARLCWPVKARNQTLRTLTRTTEIHIGINAAQCNLGNHLPYAADLDRSLLQYAPDLFNQLIDDMLIADLGGNMLYHRAADQCQLALLPLGFACFTKQHVQVDGQYLGQVVMRLFRRHRLMQVFTARDRQQTQFAEPFDDDRIGLWALQGKGGQRWQ